MEKQGENEERPRKSTAPKKQATFRGKRRKSNGERDEINLDRLTTKIL